MTLWGRAVMGAGTGPCVLRYVDIYPKRPMSMEKELYRKPGGWRRP